MKSNKHATALLWVLITIVMSLTGCGKETTTSQSTAANPMQAPTAISGPSPKEKFMQSAVGLWTLDNKISSKIAVINGKTIIKQDTNLIVLEPNGEFDEANQILPMKSTYYQFSPSVIGEPLLGAVPLQVALTSPDWNTEMVSMSRKNFYVQVKAIQGLSLKNLSTAEGSFKFGIQMDDGRISTGGFVRNLNDTEKSELTYLATNIDQKIAEQNKMVDQNIDQYLATH